MTFFIMGKPMYRHGGLMSTVARASKYIGPAVKVAARVAKAYSASRTKTSQQSERSGGEPVTSATDVRVDYRRKRRGRGSKRRVARAKRFTRAVLKVTDKRESPVRVLMYNSGVATCIAGAQGFVLSGGTMLGTIRSSSNPGERDMYAVATALGDTITSQTQMRCKSALLEMSLYNAMTYDVFCEVWTIKPRKVYGNGPTLTTEYAAGLTYEPAVLTGSANVTTATYGQSPFMNRAFTENFLILKKETIKLSAASSTNLTLKTRLPNFFNFDKYAASQPSCDQRSIGYLITFYGPPDATTAAPSACKVCWNTVKTYVFESPRSLGLPQSYQVVNP